jgi:hypothetical protein
MRPWLKWTLIGIVTLVLGWATIGGIAAYHVFRHMERRTTTEVQTLADFDAVHARFGTRPPLVEIVDPRSGDIRINRVEAAGARPIDTLHILSWNADDHELLKTQAPVWLLKFNTLTMLSRLGIGPEKFRLTVDDIRRYGPGIVVDYGPAGSTRVLIWVD